MKKMNLKKVAAFVLAGTMAIGMSTSVFAANVNVTKKYTATNTDTTSPAETFEYTVTNLAVTDAASDVSTTNMPTPTIGSATYEAGGATTAGASNPITLTMPTNYSSVGVYYYTVKETAGTNAGVNYSNEEKVLKVTVVNGETAGTYAVAGYVMYDSLDHAKADSITGKDDGVFENTYSAAKSIDISKTVNGNLGDKTKYFKVKVTLNGEEGKTYPTNGYSVTGGSYTSNPQKIVVGTATEFYIKSGETLSIANVPYNVTYTVDEDCPNDYTPSGEVTAAATVDAATETVSIVNEKNTTVDTGVIMTFAPYIAMIAAACVFAVVFFRRRTDA